MIIKRALLDRGSLFVYKLILLLIKTSIMGHMKWIFDMIVDGSYEDFKKEYIKCVLTRQDTFNWGSKNIAKTYGKSVVKYVDEYLIHEYDKHIDQCIESEEMLRETCVNY